MEGLRDMRDELDDEVVLALIASAGWVLRDDFGARLGDDDACGVRFNHLHERFEGKVPFDEILDVWKDLPTLTAPEPLLRRARRAPSAGGRRP